jgi:uncharacterized protein YpmS
MKGVEIMNISPAATDLIEAIENYIETSSKKEYRFTEEEQYKLEREIAILNKQIEILINYELKRDK